MDKNKICKALYALPGGVVVKRRKPIVIPVLLLLVGAALLVLNNMYGTELNINLRSALVFVGGVLGFTGLVVLIARVFGSGGIPFHNTKHCYLHYKELYFDRTLRSEVLEMVADGGVEKLLAGPHVSVPALSVAMYHTPDNSFAVMQVFEYSELEYRPASDLKIIGV